MTEVTAQSKPSVGRARTTAEFRIYEHSNLFYWWIVILAGYVFAAITYVDGEQHEILGKKLLYYSGAWLGLSFVGLLLFVILVTNVKAQGVYSYVILLLIVLSLYFVPKVPGYEALAGRVPDLRIHLNLAFYLSFTTGLLIIWLVVFVAVDHFSWWHFHTGQVSHRHRFGHGTDRAYTTEGMTIYRLPDDFFRHKLLGLRWIGLGTGDFIITPKDADPIEMRNVLMPTKKLARMETLVATRQVTVGPREARH